jgi:asparagine synthase (glutamine-hydrolysing)
MCGILAIINLETDQKLRSTALGKMTHRGPDGEGEWSSEEDRVWLGHRRLSIVDLSANGQQPMTNEDQSLWLVCNGEIYNYPSLRKELLEKGHQLASHCDSEILLHAYEEWATDLFRHLQGMFGFALWDRQRKRLLAARDYMGIKPLYYARVGQGLILASDLESLLPLMPVRPRPDAKAMAHFLTLGFVPSPRTIWENIYKLEPGHYLEFYPESNELAIHQYWEPPRYIKAGYNYDPTEWESLFNEVIKEHLLADVPIGLFLSGGLDSTSVAISLSELNSPLEALTISFPNTGKDEAPVAEKVSQYLGIPHTIIPIEYQHINPIDLLRRASADFDEPIGATGPISKYHICKAASDANYKVVFGGDGGDELFAGYHRFLNLQDTLPSSLLWIRQLIRPLMKHGPTSSLRGLAMKHFEAASPLYRHRWRLYPRFLPEEAEMLLKPMGLSYTDEDMMAPYLKHFEPSLPLQRALQRVDLMTYCMDGVLARTDKASMAHSLEWRVPMLDKRIIEWAMVQPFEVKNSKQTKPVLRNYLRSKHIPEEVLTHPKQGFSLRGLGALEPEELIPLIQQGKWVNNGYWAHGWEQLLAPDVPRRNERTVLLLLLTLWAENHL